MNYKKNKGYEMKEDEVIKLMESSLNANEWNKNADKVKEAYNGYYPKFWYKAIVVSGVLAITQSRWETA